MKNRREFLRNLARGGACALLLGGLASLAGRPGPKSRCAGCVPERCPQARCRFRPER